ncbi:hypothetical protein NX029_26085 [Cytobacillus firmus]|nr:hypothetical protein [Cytobacillus firmus]
MIPINAEIKLRQTKMDNWGISVPIAEETHKGFLNFKLVVKGETSAKEFVPSGSFIIHGFNSISPEDEASFTDNGREYRIKPEDVTYIKDSSGQVMFTKVAF